jgi:hypothetical protein
MDTDRDDSITVEVHVCAHNNSHVLETKTRVDGSVRRRHECRDCGERWTTVRHGEKPGRERLKPSARRLARRKLTLEEVYRVLTERQTPNKSIAAELGVSRQCIELIRSGATWSDVFPELPRNVKRLSCLRCKHWRSEECAIGFPDPMEEGPGFAVDCDFYEV